MHQTRFHSASALARMTTCVATAILLSGVTARASERTQQLQGIFCNSEAQVESVLSLITAGAPAASAVAIVNTATVNCTLVDLLQYVVSDVVQIGWGDGPSRQVRFRANLIGVVVGDRLRSVSPPAVVYFVSREFVEAPLELKS